MGSLNPLKTPKLPKVSTPVVTTTDDEISEEAQRAENILRRRRGRLGTINTSFRGVLTDGGKSIAPKRKTLLGE